MKVPAIRRHHAGPLIGLCVVFMPLLLTLLLGGTGCRSVMERAGGAPADWRAWQASRRESLAGSNGWTTLVARYWLPEGATFVGASPTNHLVLPVGRAPEYAGRLTRRGRIVHFEAAPGVAASVDGQLIAHSPVPLTSDLSNAPTRLVIGSLSLGIIERGDRFGVRVRDPGSPARQRFKGPECFSYDADWRVPGTYEPFASVRTMRLRDVLGGTQELPSPGAIRFERNGQTYRLEVAEEVGETNFFVMFRDRTAGVSTYPSGRFLYVERPNSDGRVTIDFNRAYTPPCGYTAFATCPLPPAQNWLPFPIQAGEKMPRAGIK